MSVLIIVGFSFIENREKSGTQAVMPNNPFKLNILHRRNEIWARRDRVQIDLVWFQLYQKQGEV